MNILIAPDSFKDSLSAKQAGEAIRRGILSVKSDCNILVLPMADGGEGTVDALIDATGGALYEEQVYDPLMRPVNARYGILGDGSTAVIEMAAASGLELLKPEDRKPWITSTYGTGQLIKAALNKGCNRIIIGIGGSATNDAGMGMAEALGVKFLDSHNNSVGQGGGNLSAIQTIDITHIDSRIINCDIIVASDVTNPLTGNHGAAVIYGPQKGADDKMVARLDENLNHFAGIVKKQLHKDIDKIPGSGAAGGLGAGFLAFTMAKIMPGFEIVRQETQLDQHIKWADLVITGEGKLDYQTQFGKTPAGVAKVAKIYHKPVLAIAGTLGEGYQELYNYGFDAIISIIDKPMTLSEALISAPELLQRAAAGAIRLFFLSSNK